MQNELDAAMSKVRNAGAAAYNAAIDAEQKRLRFLEDRAAYEAAMEMHTKAKATFDEANAELQRVVGIRGA